MTKLEAKIILYNILISMRLEEMSSHEIALKNILENDDEVKNAIRVKTAQMMSR